MCHFRLGVGDTICVCALQNGLMEEFVTASRLFYTKTKSLRDSEMLEHEPGMTPRYHSKAVG